MILQNLLGFDKIHVFSPSIEQSKYLMLKDFVSDKAFKFIFHLAAQAGVRYSFENPQVYIDSNIKGFINILECCKTSNIKKLFYASSSSVYGNCKNLPFRENDSSIQPISLYGITKKMNEELADMYFRLYKIMGRHFRKVQSNKP